MGVFWTTASLGRTLATMIALGSWAFATWALLMTSAGPPDLTGGPAPSFHRMKNLRLVVIDPGHGGTNRGCLGVDGSWEKDVVLTISQRVERILLEETSAAVMLTRRDDRALGLRQRSELANRWGADVFLSIHLNADSWGTGFGVETWFLSSEALETAGRSDATQTAAPAWDLEALEASRLGEVIADVERNRAHQDSELLAETVGEALRAHTRATFRGVKQAAFGVLKHARMPAVVVEAGFFSHAEEGWKLIDPAYQDKLARAIVDGIISWDALGSPSPRTAKRWHLSPPGARSR